MSLQDNGQLNSHRRPFSPKHKTQGATVQPISNRDLGDETEPVCQRCGMTLKAIEQHPYNRCPEARSR